MARAKLLSAALRHVRDAEHLLAEGPSCSIEQALHLCGFGPECARKACLDEGIADKALGHEVRDEGDPVVDWLLACDPAASRYEVGAHELRLALRAKYWSANCRYLATGEASRPVVRGVVEEARRFVDACVLELWCDGAIPEEGLR